MDNWENRFWSKVNKTETCWLWTASVRHDGYGQFRLDGRTRAPHQVAFEWANGPVPSGMFVDHMCHVTLCVNPAHLRACTVKESNENTQGARVNSKSGVRGVHWHRHRKKWCASVTHNYEAHFVGYFDLLADAEAAVIAKRNELFTHNVVDRRVAVQ